MQPDRRQPGPLSETLESMGESVGFDRVAQDAGEHVPAVVIVGARRLAFGVLAGAVPAQRDHSGAMPSLRRARDDMPVELLQLLADHRNTIIEVDVAPAQPGRLTPA